MASRAYHVEYGRHSNIPDCCIAFWLGRWQSIFDKPEGERHRVSVGYVPCPKCLEEKRFVAVHQCRGCDKPIKAKYKV